MAERGPVLPYGEGEALWRAGARPSVRGGRQGITVLGRFIPVSDERPGAILCVLSDGPAVRGTLPGTCCDCRREIWVSPGSQDVLRRYQDVPTICIECMLKRERIA